MEFKIAALLPVKLHSERVPGKNFRALAGKPLIRWMVETLLEVAEVDVVVINTDAPTEVAESLGLEDERLLIRERRAEICGDFVSMNRIIEDDIENVAASTYLMTHATNPFLSAKTIETALSRYAAAIEEGEADSLFSVTKYLTRFYRADGSAVNHDPNELIRTQDLEPWFEENSCLYIFSAESFRRTDSRIGDRPVLFETPRLESVDIDDSEDWQLAEALASQSLEGTGTDS